MKILALDTATEACSAALYIEGELLEEYQLAPRRQTELILPMVDDLMQQADLSALQLDAIAFGCGPGSFTGVRLAAAVTQGIAYAADLPVIPVSTLAALAFAALETQQNHTVNTVLTAIDARMSEVYWAVYQQTEYAQLEPLVDEQVVAPQQVICPADLQDTVAAGSGWITYGDELLHAVSHRPITIAKELLPHASSIARLAVLPYQNKQYFSAEQAQPVYLRNRVANRSGGR